MFDNVEIIEDFQCGGRRCLVVKRNDTLDVNEMIMHIGYVELLPGDRYCDLILDSEEETFRGKLRGLAEEYVGFDTARTCNYDQPITQRKGYSVKACKMIVDELNLKRLKKDER